MEGGGLLPDGLLHLEQVLVDPGHRGVPLGPEEGKPDRLKRVLLRKGFGGPEAVRQAGGVVHLDRGFLLLEEDVNKAMEVGALGWVRGDVVQHSGACPDIASLRFSGDVGSAGERGESENSPTTKNQGNTHTSQ